MNAIDEEMKKTRVIQVQLSQRQLVRLHALTLGTDETISDILADALSAYDESVGFQPGTVRP